MQQTIAGGLLQEADKLPQQLLARFFAVQQPQLKQQKQLSRTTPRGARAPVPAGAHTEATDEIRGAAAKQAQTQQRKLARLEQELRAAQQKAKEVRGGDHMAPRVYLGLSLCLVMAALLFREPCLTDQPDVPPNCVVAGEACEKRQARAYGGGIGSRSP